MEWPQFYKDGKDDFGFAVCHDDTQWRDHEKLPRKFKHDNVYSAVLGKRGINSIFAGEGDFREIAERDGEAKFVVIWSLSAKWMLISDGSEIVLAESTVVETVKDNPNHARSLISSAFVAADDRKKLAEFERENLIVGDDCCFAYHKTDERGGFQKSSFYSNKSKKLGCKFYVISGKSRKYCFEGVFQIVAVIEGEQNPYSKKYEYKLHDLSSLDDPLPLAGIFSDDYLRSQVSGGIPFLSVPINDQALLESAVARLRNEPSEDDEYLLRLLENDKLDREVKVRQRGEQDYVRRKIFGENKYHKCIICDDHFPVELLVAAHVRKRSKCDSAMKVDFQNNVFPMCRLGCDELFERGFIVVNQSGVIEKIWSIPLQGRVEDHIDTLNGKSCNQYQGEAKKYFDWHFDHHS